MQEILSGRKWERKTVALGVASDEIDGHNITEDKIISCIKDMELHYEERYQKVKQLSEKIRNEKGLEVAPMTAYEIVSIFIGILALLMSFGSLIVVLLAFLDKRNKRK